MVYRSAKQASGDEYQVKNVVVVRKNDNKSERLQQRMSVECEKYGGQVPAGQEAYDLRSGWRRNVNPPDFGFFGGSSQ